MSQRSCASANITPSASLCGDGVCHWQSLFESASPAIGSAHAPSTPLRQATSSEMMPPPLNSGMPMGPTANVCHASPTGVPMQSPAMAPMHSVSCSTEDVSSYHGGGWTGAVTHPHGYGVEMHTPSYGVPAGPQTGYWMQQAPPGFYGVPPNSWVTMGMPYSCNHVMQPVGAPPQFSSPSSGHRQRHIEEPDIATPPDIVGLRRQLVAARATLLHTLSTAAEYTDRRRIVSELEFDLARRERQEKEDTKRRRSD